MSFVNLLLGVTMISTLETDVRYSIWLKTNTKKTISPSLVDMFSLIKKND